MRRTERPSANADRDPIAKALGLLQWFLEEPRKSVGVREAAAALAIAPSSAHRLLNALVRQGFLQIEGTSGNARYSLGLETVRLAHIVLARDPVRDVAFRHLRRFVESCNETVFLGLYSRQRRQMLFGPLIESSLPLRYVIDTQHWVPVHAGASGLAVMAFLSDEERAAIIEERGLHALTDATITDPVRLARSLRDIRARGYAITRGQRIPGAVGLAAPIFGPDGAVLGDIATSIPEQRFDKASEKRIAPMVLRCADETTQDIGGQRPGKVVHPLASGRKGRPVENVIKD